MATIIADIGGKMQKFLFKFFNFLNFTPFFLYKF